MENEEKRMLGDYEVKQSIHIGKKEVVFGVNEADKYPFMVCYCTYDNPLSAAWPTEGVGTDDYLEAMQIFTDRVQAQIEVVKEEQSRFDFDMTPFTTEDCIPDNRNESIVGKVVVINAELNRYEYQHSAYQLVLVDGGHGAIGGRGQAVFGTCLADAKRARWERYDVLGVIKPEKMPDWAKEAVAKINKELYGIRKELEAVDASKQFPNPFNPLTDQLPAEIDKEFDKAIEAAKANNEEALLNACHAIEAYFNFPKPNELVKKAEVPGGMYSNMVAQLKQLNSMDILEKAMELIPTVRLAAGLPPLVTPTSQIVGAQAVNCALDIKAGKPMYSNVSNQFVNLVKGEYGKTPVPVDPEFRLKIAGTREEIPYDTSKYQMQPNPELPEAGGVKLAANEKEVLLLELFPQVAKNFLTKQKVAAYEAQHKADAPQAEKVVAEEKKNEPITGKTVKAPMPGSILRFTVKPGDTVTKSQTVVILEAMKMENSIATDYAGTVKRLLVKEGTTVAADAPMIEIEA